MDIPSDRIKRTVHRLRPSQRAVKATALAVLLIVSTAVVVAQAADEDFTEGFEDYLLGSESPGIWNASIGSEPEGNVEVTDIRAVEGTKSYLANHSGVIGNRGVSEAVVFENISVGNASWQMYVPTVGGVDSQQYIDLRNKSRYDANAGRIVRIGIVPDDGAFQVNGVEQATGMADEWVTVTVHDINISAETLNVTFSNATDTQTAQANFRDSGPNGYKQIEFESNGGSFSSAPERKIFLDDVDLKFVKSPEVLADETTLDLELTRHFLKHGERAGYSVTLTTVDADGDENQTDITDAATVTSDDPTNVSVDTGAREIVGTSDKSVNIQTFVTATYSEGGDTFSEDENVTVANATVNNLKILPPLTRFTASLDGGTDDNPDDKTIMVLIIGTAAAAAISIFATSLAGLGGLTAVMLGAWILGATNDGMIIVTVFTAMFIGMNVAGNVNYDVRK